MLDLSACQSPMETRFGCALWEVAANIMVAAPKRSDTGLIASIPGWSSGLALQPDFGWCRPDFMLVSLFGVGGPMDNGWDGAAVATKNVLIIEIDGHDYHERTKEQARRDRSRDRKMIAEGWIPMRFTGQEVYQDACACAEQAMQCFIDRQGNVMDDAFSNYIEYLGRKKAAAERAGG